MSSNWKNDLTVSIEIIQEKLENAISRVGNNPEVKRTYQEAMDATQKQEKILVGLLEPIIGNTLVLNSQFYNLSIFGERPTNPGARGERIEMECYGIY